MSTRDDITSTRKVISATENPCLTNTRSDPDITIHGSDRKSGQTSSFHGLTRLNFMIHAIRGTYDVLPNEVGIWHALEQRLRDTFHAYGFGEIRTPIFEATELFVRGVGEETDIVSKEMYTFTDRDGDSLSLRPEGTAPVIRAYIEHQLQNEARMMKLYYLGPMFVRDIAK